MRLILILVALLFSSTALAWEQQHLPCEELSRLWVSKYYNKLKPNWGYGRLPCHKSVESMSRLERVQIMTARAAYVLDKTVFNYRLYRRPIVSYGRIQAIPNMLDWVGARLKGLVFNAYADYAYANQRAGKINLTIDDYKNMDNGIGLAGQIIHETRHLGPIFYGHVECTVPGQSGPNCDPTISEEFDNGGSHAVAALWLAYVARNSFWPESDREQAAEVVRWVLKNRINDSYEVRNAWSERYLGERL